MVVCGRGVWSSWSSASDTSVSGAGREARGEGESDGASVVEREGDTGQGASVRGEAGILLVSESDKSLCKGVGAEKDDSSVVVSGGDEAAARKSAPFLSDGAEVDVTASGDCDGCTDGGEVPDGDTEGAEGGCDSQEGGSGSCVEVPCG